MEREGEKKREKKREREATTSTIGKGGRREGGKGNVLRGGSDDGE